MNKLDFLFQKHEITIYGDQKMALVMDGKNENLKLKSFVDFGVRHGLQKNRLKRCLKS